MPSACRKIHLALDPTEWDVGLVEGEHVPAATDADLPRGQAEGEQEGAAVGLGTPRILHVLSENGSSNEWESESKL